MLKIQIYLPRLVMERIREQIGQEYPALQPMKESTLIRLWITSQIDPTGQINELAAEPPKPRKPYAPRKPKPKPAPAEPIPPIPPTEPTEPQPETPETWQEQTL